MTLRFTLDGRAVEAEPADAEMPLLHLLREEPFALNGPRFGCGLAQCGACTVLVDGRAVRSCSVPAQSVEGRGVTTLEGLGTAANPHPLQAAVAAERVAQCDHGGTRMRACPRGGDSTFRVQSRAYENMLSGQGLEPSLGGTAHGLVSTAHFACSHHHHPGRYARR